LCDLSFSLLLIIYQEWRASKMHIVAPEEIAAQVAKAKAYFHRRDKRGSPLIFVLVAKRVYPNL
jgi:hypothetical protein